MATEIKFLLAENLHGLMQKSFNLNTQMKVRKASQVLHPKTGAVVKAGLTQSTIQRALSAEVNVGLDTLQCLADVFGVSPVKLISPKGATDKAAVPDASDLAWLLLDEFESLPQDQALRADAFSACLVALGIVVQQHAQQTPAPSPTVRPKKARG